MRKLKLFLCSNISLLILIKFASAELQYIPPSREIEVTDGGDYTFGIIEDYSVNITRCYYTSDTGINGYFDVDKRARLMELEKENNILPYSNFDNNRTTKVVHNEFTHEGRLGTCRVRIRWADNKGPTRWTLTPLNNLTGGHVGNLSFITYNVKFFNKGSILENKIAVYEHASFINYINMTPHANLILCTLEFKNIKIELDLHSHMDSIFSTDDEEILDRLSSLGQGLCGFKYTDATKTINELEWVLTATDDKGLLHQGKFQTITLRRDVLHTKKEVAMGDSFYIQCGDPFNMDFCYLLNPAGKIVQTNRGRYLDTTFKMADIGIWRCYAGNKHSMESTEYTFELVEKAATTVITWANETDHYVSIGCQLSANTYKISNCKMITPKLEVLDVQPFSATDRYVAIGTDYEKAICSIQIQKPLQEAEKGMWQCEIVGGVITTGGFIEVDKTENIDYPKNLKVVTRLDEPFTVSCKVPYSSEFCSIRAPNGTQYRNGENFVPQLGRCSLTIASTVQSDNGIWTCSFAQETGVPDDTINVEVSIAENLVHDELVKGTHGGTTTLMCHSNGLPLEYCRFTNPQAVTYHIHNHENSTSISYYGKGLEYGDCGITISNTQNTDFGYWVCATQIIGDKKYGELSAAIIVIY